MLPAERRVSRRTGGPRSPERHDRRGGGRCSRALATVGCGLSTHCQTLPCGCCADRESHTFGSLPWVVVLPHPNHGPSRLREPSVGVAVARRVAFQLVPPPLGVCPRPAAVSRAGVPVAAVHEDGHPGSGEHEIGAATHRTLGAHVQAVAQAARVQQTAQGKLRRRIPARLALHAAARCIVGGRWRCRQGPTHPVEATKSFSGSRSCSQNTCTPSAARLGGNSGRTCPRARRP